MSLADRMAVLDAGRVVQWGTPEELYREPASPFVARFMGADNAIELDLSDGGWSVAGDAHRLTSALPAAVAIARAANGRAVAHFRSDAARLAVDPPGSEWPVLPGTIASRAYLGNRFRYGVRTGAQQIWVDDATRHEVGAVIHVVVPFDAWHVYPTNA